MSVSQKGNHGLTAEGYDRALRSLARRDRDFTAILKRHGAPPMWSRRPGFSTLVHIILTTRYRVLVLMLQPFHALTVCNCVISGSFDAPPGGLFNFPSPY